MSSVEHPKHYGGDTLYETIKVLEAWMTPEQFIGGLRFNAIKYLSRAGKKGDADEDLAKAKFYVDYEIAYITRMTLGNLTIEEKMKMRIIEEAKDAKAENRLTGSRIRRFDRQHGKRPVRRKSGKG